MRHDLVTHPEREKEEEHIMDEIPTRAVLLVGGILLAGVVVALITAFATGTLNPVIG